MIVINKVLRKLIIRLYRIPSIQIHKDNNTERIKFLVYILKKIEDLIPINRCE